MWKFKRMKIFQKNCSNKQFHELQSAQYGQEAFTLFTAACFHKSDINIENSKDDKGSGFKVLSLVIVSNDTIYESKISFSCNVKLLNIVRKSTPNLHKAFFGMMALFTVPITIYFSITNLLYNRLENNMGLQLSSTYKGSA